MCKGAENYIVRISIVIIILIAPILTYSQNPKRALKYHNKAVAAFNNANFEEAFSFCQKAVKADSLSTKSFVLLGTLYEEMGNIPQAISVYQKAKRRNDSAYNDLGLILGELYFSQLEYAYAINELNDYLNKTVRSVYKIKRAHELLRLAEYRQKAMENTLFIRMNRLDTVINSSADEYINSITPDNSQLIFTRKQKVLNNLRGQGHYRENIFISASNGIDWSDAELFKYTGADYYNEGAASISPDGKYLFLTSCYRESGLGSCDIYYSKRTKEGWSSIRNLGSTINSQVWESQPSFSSDGKTLYFSAKKPDAIGGSDIYSSALDTKGHWTRPENLGDSINTPGNEMAPFIHPDGHTLYFSSDGHMGMGSKDIFISKRNHMGIWSKARNLPFPINTYNDEINMIVGPDGITAYISKRPEGDSSNYDIFSFELPIDFQADKVTYLKGSIVDAEKGNFIDASIEVTDLSTNTILTNAIQEKGEESFLIVLPLGKNLAFNIDKEGYLFYSKNIRTDTMRTVEQPKSELFELSPIQVGEKLRLNNVFFDTDKYILKEESLFELGKVVSMLKENPALKIEISGHTDNIGTKRYNYILSEKRAQAVYNYFVESGINTERMTYVGYGDSIPLNDNSDANKRALNRRTEIIILSTE